MQQFNIDISQPRGPLVLYVSQGDSLSRFFAVTVTDNGAAYEPPAGAIYTVRFGAPGKPAGWYDTIEEVGGSTHPAVVVDENTYTVEIAEQALGTPGENALVLIVSDATGYTLASWVFVLQVAAVPGYDAPEATVYYNALSEQVAQVLSGTTAAAASATLAESWAVGGTGTRPGEDTDNAQYYAQQAQSTSNGQLGWYATEQALQAAHPTGTNGQWAIIGSTDTIWTWDSDTSAWVNSGDVSNLSDYYTKEQSDARYATAAQGTLASSAVQSVNGLPGPNPSLTAANVGAAPAENGVNIYIHSRTGTVNNFVGTGPNGRAKMTADVQAGDTFTVNGVPVAAYMGTDDAAGSMAGSAWNGKWVSFITEAGVISFAGGAEKAERVIDVTVSGGTLFPPQASLKLHKLGRLLWFETVGSPSNSPVEDMVTVNKNEYLTLTLSEPINKDTVFFMPALMQASYVRFGSAQLFSTDGRVFKTKYVFSDTAYYARPCGFIAVEADA